MVKVLEDTLRTEAIVPFDFELSSRDLKSGESTLKFGVKGHTNKTEIDHLEAIWNVFGNKNILESIQVGEEDLKTALDTYWDNRDNWELPLRSKGKVKGFVERNLMKSLGRIYAPIWISKAKRSLKFGGKLVLPGKIDLRELDSPNKSIGIWASSTLDETSEEFKKEFMEKLKTDLYPEMDELKKLFPSRPSLEDSLEKVVEFDKGKLEKTSDFPEISPEINKPLDASGVEKMVKNTYEVVNKFIEKISPIKKGTEVEIPKPQLNPAIKKKLELFSELHQNKGFQKGIPPEVDYIQLFGSSGGVPILPPRKSKTPIERIKPIVKKRASLLGDVLRKNILSPESYKQTEKLKKGGRGNGNGMVDWDDMLDPKVKAFASEQHKRELENSGNITNFNNVQNDELVDFGMEYVKESLKKEGVDQDTIDDLPNSDEMGDFLGAANKLEESLGEMGDGIGNVTAGLLGQGKGGLIGKLFETENNVNDLTQSEIAAAKLKYMNVSSRSFVNNWEMNEVKQYAENFINNTPEPIREYVAGAA